MSSAPAPHGGTVTTLAITEKKAHRELIVVVTAYDAPSAKLAEEAGVDIILVGDSVGMTVLGRPDTLSVTMDEMLHHTRAVARGAHRAMIVADMPFMSFQVTPEEALRNAGRLVAEAGAQAVKLEGGRRVTETVRKIVEAGIPVMGHVGLTPQSVHALGGYRVQAKEASRALQLIDDCRALQDAGAFSVVLECIPAELAEIVTRELAIATIGIGAGGGCDGQVQVYHDLVGLGAFTPKHAKRYAELGTAVREAIGAYAHEVRTGAFPEAEQGSSLDPAVVEQIEAALAGGIEGGA